MIAARRANMRSGARTDLEPSLNLDEVVRREGRRDDECLR
jgi:hypothetical protein